MLRILVVDDDPDMRRLAKRALEPGGFEVEAVNRGLVAVESIRLGQYSAVLMDLMMPEMDGFETVARIRAWERATERSPIPILPFSSEPAAHVRERCRAHGMVGFVAKPLEPAGLLEIVRDALLQVPCNSSRIRRLGNQAHDGADPDRA